MGFLAPLFVLAAAAVAVPLVLHLFKRRDPRRVPFPALRYLRRAERDHARSIRFRQLLLLILRVVVVLLLVAAGARLYLRAGSSSHEPTALALILDNSLSSGLVQDDRRILDGLKDRALESVEVAGPDDRVWVLRAGEPWDLTRPATPEEARRRIRETEPSEASGDLTAALRRGASLVRESELPATEIHLLSDLQASAFRDDGAPDPGGGLPVVTLLPPGDTPANRWVGRVEIAGGLPPLAGEPSELVVSIGARPSSPDSLSVRLLVDGRVRGAGLGPPGSEIILPLGPFDGGAVAGRVELEPDALRADDQRHFAFRIRPPSRVRVAGPAGDATATPDFLGQALTVMEEAGRIRLVERGDEARVLLSRGGAGLEDLPPGTPAVVIPPSDPTVLPALNRRLTDAGIPLELAPVAAEEGAEIRIRRSPSAPDLEEIRVYRHYRLHSTEPASTTDALLVLTTGEAWVVSGQGARGPYLVLGSPLEPEATNLPVSASMIRFLEWALSAWPAGSAGAPSVLVGEPLPRIPGATAVATPGGTLRSLVGTAAPPEARSAGVYRILRGDTLLDVVAANPPPSESDLTPVGRSRLEALVGPGLVPVREPSAWSRRIFVQRQGPELWRPLLVAAFLVLLAESVLAAGGRSRRARTGDPTSSDPTPTGEPDPEEVRARA